MARVREQIVAAWLTGCTAVLVTDAVPWSSPAFGTARIVELDVDVVAFEDGVISAREIDGQEPVKVPQMTMEIPGRIEIDGQTPVVQRAIHMQMVVQRVDVNRRAATA